MSLNRNTYSNTIQQPDDSNVTDVELGEEDVGDIELTDMKSAIEPRTRFNDFVLEPGMITLEHKNKNIQNKNKRETMVANTITEYGDSELILNNTSM